MTPEGNFKAALRTELKLLFPGCVITKNDAGNVQGIPDMTIFHNGKYAWLEFKRATNASKRPNQEYYINKCKAEGAYASFCYPENKKQVLQELVEYFE